MCRVTLTECNRVVDEPTMEIYIDGLPMIQTMAELDRWEADARQAIRHIFDLRAVELAEADNRQEAARAHAAPDVD